MGGLLAGLVDLTFTGIIRGPTPELLDSFFATPCRVQVVP